MQTPSFEHFKETFTYGPQALLIDRVISVDPTERVLRAEMETTKPLPYSQYQRDGSQLRRHVSDAEMVQLAGNLGGLLAYHLHGLRWEEDWMGFGNTIHHGEYRELAEIGPPLELEVRETRSKVGGSRLVLRFEVRCLQNGRPVYVGDQTATFMKKPHFNH